MRTDQGSPPPKKKVVKRISPKVKGNRILAGGSAGTGPASDLRSSPRVHGAPGYHTYGQVVTKRRGRHYTHVVVHRTLPSGASMADRAAQLEASHARQQHLLIWRAVQRAKLDQANTRRVVRAYAKTGSPAEATALRMTGIDFTGTHNNALNNAELRQQHELAAVNRERPQKDRVIVKKARVHAKAMRANDNANIRDLGIADRGGASARKEFNTRLFAKANKLMPGVLGQEYSHVHLGPIGLGRHADLSPSDRRRFAKAIVYRASAYGGKLPQAEKDHLTTMIAARRVQAKAIGDRQGGVLGNVPRELSDTVTGIPATVKAIADKPSTLLKMVSRNPLAEAAVGGIASATGDKRTARRMFHRVGQQSESSPLSTAASVIPLAAGENAAVNVVRAVRHGDVALKDLKRVTVLRKAARPNHLDLRRPDYEVHANRRPVKLRGKAGARAVRQRQAEARLGTRYGGRQEAPYGRGQVYHGHHVVRAAQKATERARGALGRDPYSGVQSGRVIVRHVKKADRIVRKATKIADAQQKAVNLARETRLHAGITKDMQALAEQPGRRPRAVRAVRMVGLAAGRKAHQASETLPAAISSKVYKVVRKTGGSRVRAVRLSSRVHNRAAALRDAIPRLQAQTLHPHGWSWESQRYGASQAQQLLHERFGGQVPDGVHQVILHGHGADAVHSYNYVHDGRVVSQASFVGKTGKNGERVSSGVQLATDPHYSGNGYSGQIAVRAAADGWHVGPDTTTPAGTRAHNAAQALHGIGGPELRHRGAKRAILRGRNRNLRVLASEFATHVDPGNYHIESVNRYQTLKARLESGRVRSEAHRSFRAHALEQGKSQAKAEAYATKQADRAVKHARRSLADLKAAFQAGAKDTKLFDKARAHAQAIVHSGHELDRSRTGLHPTQARLAINIRHAVAQGLIDRNAMEHGNFLYARDATLPPSRVDAARITRLRSEAQYAQQEEDFARSIGDHHVADVYAADARDANAAADRLANAHRVQRGDQVDVADLPDVSHRFAYMRYGHGHGSHDNALQVPGIPEHYQGESLFRHDVAGYDAHRSLVDLAAHQGTVDLARHYVAHAAENGAIYTPEEAAAMAAKLNSEGGMKWASVPGRQGSEVGHMVLPVEMARLWKQRFAQTTARRAAHIAGVPFALAQRQFFRAVLPFSLAWHAGNITDMATRLVVAGVMPRHGPLAAHLRAELRRLEGENPAVASLLEGTFGSHAGNRVTVMIGGRRVDMTARWVPDKVKAAASLRLIHKAANRSFDFASEYEQVAGHLAQGVVAERMARELGLQGDIAKGLAAHLASSARARERFAQLTLNMMGDYLTARRGGVFKAIVPFEAWLRASARWTFHELPANHPVKAALALQAAALTRDERARYGLSTYWTDAEAKAIGLPKPQGLFDQGALTTPGGFLLPTANITTTGTAGQMLTDPGQVAGDSILPQIAKPINSGLHTLLGVTKRDYTGGFGTDAKLLADKVTGTKFSKAGPLGKVTAIPARDHPRRDVALGLANAFVTGSQPVTRYLGVAPNMPPGPGGFVTDKTGAIKLAALGSDGKTGPKVGKGEGRFRQVTGLGRERDPNAAGISTSSPARGTKVVVHRISKDQQARTPFIDGLQPTPFDTAARGYDVLYDPRHNTYVRGRINDQTVEQVSHQDPVARMTAMEKAYEHRVAFDRSSLGVIGDATTPDNLAGRKVLRKVVRQQKRAAAAGTSWHHLQGGQLAQSLKANEKALAQAGAPSQQIVGDAGHAPPQRPPRNAVRARVTAVIDGDTIDVHHDGKTQTLRILGMDTPEVVKPGFPVQQGGLEATKAAQHLLAGKDVRVAYDQQKVDSYGRALAYVYVDGRLYNREMVRRGLALPLAIPPDNAHLGQIERDARAARMAVRRR